MRTICPLPAHTRDHPRTATLGAASVNAILWILCTGAPWREVSLARIPHNLAPAMAAHGRVRTELAAAGGALAGI